IQSMTLNNPPDQPSVKQITTKNNFSYTSYDHHPLTATPFSENNTATPTTPTTLTTLTTLSTNPAPNPAIPPPLPTPHPTPTTLSTLTTLATVHHPAANLAQLTCNPRYSHYSRYSYYSFYQGPPRLKLSPSTHHPRAHYPDSIVTLRCAQGLSRWAERCFAAA